MIKKTVIVSSESEDIGSKLDFAGSLIRRGGLVVFPTETVYGLGADATDRSAVEKIFKAKGRPQDNPLIVHICDVSQLRDLTDEVSEKASVLIEAFWPGPLTILFKKKDNLPEETTGGLDTVAVRMPNHPLALDFIKKAQRPIAAPSANTSGRPSPTRMEHAQEDLDGKVDMIIDGGPTGLGLESTVLDLSGDRPLILRPGGITREMLLDYLEDVDYDRSIEDINEKPRSPGQKYRHYSPKADMQVYSGEPELVIEAIAGRIKEGKQEGKRVGLLTVDENIDRYECDFKISMGSSKNLEQVARKLFDALRGFDLLEVDLVVAEGLSEEGLGKAIMNRMAKAAGGKVYYL